ncbi:hypothetical protein TNCT_488291 [Trichonephila clavata]|uniref:Uncharacterized protein n=1 Tax=Trichonephila clavata TaxID=2740835 RepID=A0A8X6I1D3_TRICU|nr:hypothetical protein TNCT_488291 [Trichonephila clavata]
MIDVHVVNTWTAYHLMVCSPDLPDGKLSLLDVRRRKVLFYLSKKRGSKLKRRGPQGNILMGGRVRLDVRLDPGSHSIVPTKTQKRCTYCKKTRRKCVIGVMLVSMIRECFVSSHTP